MNKTIVIDPRIKQRNATDLMDIPVVIRIAKFDEDTTKAFAEDMSKAHCTGQPVIPIVIDSYGGEAYSVMTMITEIQNARVPVATIVEGKAMSCGAILFGFGNPGMRYAGPNATIMVHDVSSVTFGKVEELKADATHLGKLNKTIYRMLARHCGHEDEDYFLKIIHQRSHADWYLSAAKAKKHKLADHVGVPSLVTRVSVDTKFE
jgi:ATP-dependent protease ClpP protease subunit